MRLKLHHLENLLQVPDLLFAKFVAKGFVRHPHSAATRSSTPMRNHTSAIFVAKPSTGTISPE